MLVLSQLRLTIFLLEGQEKSSGRSLTILVYGKERSWPFLRGLVFSDLGKKEKLGRLFIWNVGSSCLSLESRADIIFVHIDEIFHRLLKSQGFLAIPEWISFRFDLARPVEQTLALAKSKTVRENLRRIRKHNYIYTVTYKPTQFDDFYRMMYLPYVPGRYGDSARLVGYHFMKLFFESGAILLVKEQEENVSGSVIMTRKKSAKTMILGLRDGNMEHKKKGALAASYYFTILWAKKQGYRCVDFGECRPFLNDGLFYFKKSWGTTMKRYWHLRNVFAMKIRNFGPAAETFLTHNPFAILDHGALTGLVLLEQDHPLSGEEVQSLLRAYLVPGLDRLIVVSPHGPDPQAKKIAANVDNFRVSLVRGTARTLFSSLS